MAQKTVVKLTFAYDDYDQKTYSFTIPIATTDLANMKNRIINFNEMAIEGTVPEYMTETFITEEGGKFEMISAASIVTTNETVVYGAA